MKNIFTLLLAFCSCYFVQAQSTHIVVASGTSFTPANLTAVAGDTIVADFIGTHSMTEVSEADWNDNTPNSNGGFWIGVNAPTENDWFVLNEVGTYYYICIPHAMMGMKGIIEVIDPPLGIEEDDENNFAISPVGNGQFNLDFEKCDEFMVFTTAGQQQFSQSLRGSGNRMNVDLSSLAKGAYVGVFVNNGESVRSIKFVR